MGSTRRSSVGPFTDDQAPSIEDVLLQAEIFTGIGEVEAGAYHCDCWESELERGLMSRCVDSSCEARNNDPVATGQASEEAPHLGD